MTAEQTSAAQGRPRARWIRTVLMVLVIGGSLTGLGLVIASFWRPFYGSLAMGSDYRGHSFANRGRITICIEEEGWQSIGEFLFKRHGVTSLRSLYGMQRSQAQFLSDRENRRKQLNEKLQDLRKRRFREEEMILLELEEENMMLLEANTKIYGSLFPSQCKFVEAEVSRLAKKHGYAGLVFKFDSNSEERFVLSLPAWLLFVFFLMGPGVVIWRIVRGRSRYSILDCKHCGYNLTGNTSGRCPECGTSVSVASADGAAVAGDVLRSNG